MASPKLTLLLELKNKLKGGLDSAANSVKSTLGDLKDKFNSFKNAHVEGFKNILNEIPFVGNALKLLTNPYALITASVLALGDATAASINRALDWETSMAKVNVTAQLGKSQLKGLSDQILNIGAKGANELDQVPLAFNRIISAGLDVNTSLKALEPTLKAAKAGFADVETVAAAGVGVMNSSGEDINRVYDVLFATLNKGNAEFKDIAQYLPKIIPGARNAGFALDEVGGAFAFLTAKGQTAEAATTGLQNVFKSLSRPEIIYGTKQKLGLKGLGVDIFDATGKMKPFVAIMENLAAVMSKAKNKEQFVNMFSQIGLDQDAVSAVATMVQNFGDLKSTIDFTKNSAGQLDMAVENAATSTEGWKSGMNKLKVMSIQFGQLFLPMLKSIGEGFNWVMTKIFETVNWFKQLYGQSVALQDTFSALGWIVKATFAAPYLVIKTFIEQIKLIGGAWQWLMEKVFGTSEGWWIKLMSSINGVVNVFTDLWNIVKAIGEVLINITNPTKLVSAISDAQNTFKNFSFKDSFENGRVRYLAHAAEIKNGTSWDINAPNQNSPSPVPVGDLDSNLASGEDSNTRGSSRSTGIGSASQSKSIIVNIGSLHQGDNKIENKSDTDIDLTKFEQLYTELLMRSVRNVEKAY